MKLKLYGVYNEVTFNLSGSYFWLLFILFVSYISVSIWVINNNGPDFEFEIEFKSKTPCHAKLVQKKSYKKAVLPK
jgi:hypothetical protein